MIICETIGFYVAIWVCLASLTFIFSLVGSGSLDKINENSITASFFAVMAILLFIVSIFFVQFKHYPEQFGYTVIEEVEESEET